MKIPDFKIRISCDIGEQEPHRFLLGATFRGPSCFKDRANAKPKVRGRKIGTSFKYGQKCLLPASLASIKATARGSEIVFAEQVGLFQSVLANTNKGKDNYAAVSPAHPIQQIGHDTMIYRLKTQT
jgi:hypothetical protein